LKKTGLPFIENLEELKVNIVIKMFSLMLIVNQEKRRNSKTTFELKDSINSKLCNNRLQARI
jgi:hypothetical protein